MELPELDNLYQTICSWDYFSDLSDNEIISNKIESDEVYSDILLRKEIEKVPIRFQNTEEYIKIFSNIFLYETKSQITRSKQMEVNNISIT